MRYYIVQYTCTKCDKVHAWVVKSEKEILPEEAIDALDEYGETGIYGYRFYDMIEVPLDEIPEA